MKTILIVEDDMYIGNMVEEFLKDDYRILRAYSGTEALMLLERDKADLVLLDLMLPGLNGEQVLPQISGIPVIVMSAKNSIQDKVSLLMAGASDYITKPFEMEELLARIVVQLRKNETAIAADEAMSQQIKVREVTLNVDLLTAVVDGTEVSLTRTEVAILRLLMMNAGKPIGRNTILDRISEDTPDCTERSLKQHISNIRKKLQAVNGVDYIVAIYGIGFKFIE